MISNVEQAHGQAAARAASRHLGARVLKVAGLPDEDVEAMFALYHRYYAGTSRERFLADLGDKDEVIVLHDEEGVLRGFSTLKLLEDGSEGEPCRVLFSGDTIVHHRYWGEQSLAFAWIRRAGAIKAERPEWPLYWLLIVKGHRTYRYLQAFSREYYPHWDRPTPPPVQALMDRLGERMFGEHYQAPTGVIHFPVSHGHLRAEWAEPPAEVRERPEVTFFLEKNPGYRLGDELLCLTELHADNLRPLARRLFEVGPGR